MNNFRRDLKFGATGEEYILNLHPDKLQKLEGFNGDLLILKNNETIEIKTDTRPNSTGNIFLEHYSHKTKQTNGGPFKAQKDGCKYFLYMFFPCKSIFLYETDLLVDYLEKNKNNIRYHVVYQSNATGYITPIVDLRHLELKLEDII